MSKKKLIKASVGSLILVTSTGAFYLGTQVKHSNPDKVEKKLDVDDSVSIEEVCDNIKETNKRNTNLIVYEVQETKFKSSFKEDSVFPVKINFSTNFSYTITVDLSMSTVQVIGDQVFIIVNLQDVVLHNIEIETPNIQTETNIISNLKGGTISDMTSYAIEASYKSIQDKVNQDLKIHKDKIKSSVHDKVKRVYRGIPNIHIELEGDLNWE